VIPAVLGVLVFALVATGFASPIGLPVSVAVLAAAVVLVWRGRRAVRPAQPASAPAVSPAAGRSRVGAGDREGASGR
jgi:hypothetical protein